MATPKIIGGRPAQAWPAAAVGALRRRGLLTARQIVKGEVRAVDVSRSHAVALVQVDGRVRFAVKALDPGAADVQGSAERERAVYAMAAREPLLRGLVPRSHGAEHDDEFLILDAVDGVTALEVFTASASPDPRLASRLGDALSRWHRGTGGVREPPPLVPWVLDALAPERPAFVEANDSVRALLAGIPVGGALAGALAAGRARWRDTAVIHGDLRLDNCIVNGGRELRFVDWETAARGDPAWDVAAVVQELLVLAHARSLVPPSPWDAPLSAFLAAYVAGGGELDTKYLLPLVAARVLQRAIQVAAWEPGGSPSRGQRLAVLAGELASEDRHDLLADCAVRT